jgi:hypothetical protein
LAQQKVRLSIPDDYSPAERDEFATAVCDFIRDRTERGMGVKNGRTYKFPGYSAGYAASLDFKIAGKSKGKVNLRLSDEMMTDLQPLRHGRGWVEVGYERGSESNDKAEGNQLGTYGQDEPIKGGKYVRRFVDMTSAELRALISSYERERT